MTNKPRAIFGRKMKDIKELKDATYYAKKEGQRGNPYVVIKEVHLNDDEFKVFAQDFFEQQPWIEKSDGGSNIKGELRCIRVINTKTGEKILVNNEGYDYPRYTAIEEVEDVY